MHQPLYARILKNGTGRTTLLLFLLYAAVFIKTPATLPHVHDDHHAHHDTAACHTDPCHVSIYHHGGDHGCDHPYHLTAGDSYCELCDLAMLRQLHLEVDSQFDVVFENAASNYTLCTLTGTSPFRTRTGRSPPQYS